jgi:hypothetical protein
VNKSMMTGTHGTGISEDEERRISLLCDVALEKGASISLPEILLLTSMEITPEELKLLWPLSSKLDKNYDIDGAGWVKRKKRVVEPPFHGPERIPRSPVANDYEDNQYEKMRRADSNIKTAREFAALARSRNLLAICVSGSTSYGSASRGDDLDLFCITRAGNMWAFLTRSLILARAFQMLRGNSPPLCLSYVMDENYARSEFTSAKDSLFARDALSAVPISGKNFYDDLLRNSAWMSEYFPKMYNFRLKNPSKFRDTKGGETKSDPPAGFGRAANLFFYAVASSWIRVKSYILNRKLSKFDWNKKPFRVNVGLDHLVYESLSYVQLRAMYARMEKQRQQSPETSARSVGVDLGS